MHWNNFLFRQLYFLTSESLSHHLPSLHSPDPRHTPDDFRWDQVCGARGDGAEPGAPAGVPPVTGGGHLSSHHAGRRGYRQRGQHHPCREDRPHRQRHVLPRPGGWACIGLFYYEQVGSVSTSTRWAFSFPSFLISFFPYFFLSLLLFFLFPSFISSLLSFLSFFLIFFFSIFFFFLKLKSLPPFLYRRTWEQRSRS